MRWCAGWWNVLHLCFLQFLCGLFDSAFISRDLRRIPSIVFLSGRRDCRPGSASPLFLLAALSVVFCWPFASAFIFSTSSFAQPGTGFSSIRIFFALPVPLSLAVTCRDTIRINIKDHFNLRYTSRGRRILIEVEDAEALAVLAMLLPQ